MRTNFITPLYISDDGRRVRAEGPLDWEGGTGECWISFTITQGDVSASDATGNYNEGKTAWEKDADVDGDGAFQPGPARAEGWIHGHSVPAPAPWPPQSVELVYASSRGRSVPDADAAAPV